MEYEIDLARYRRAVFQRWPWVAACALLAIIVAVAMTLSLPRYYRAEASVLIQIRQTGSQVGLNTSVLNLETIDAGARRQALQALADSTAIEARLPQDVLQRVAPPAYKPGQLAGDGDNNAGAITTKLQGDLLIIAARSQTAQQAKELADAWARTFVDYANQLYTDGHSEIKLVSEALLPYRPEPSGLIRNALLSGLLGALIGIAAAVLAEIFGIPARQRQHTNHPAQPASRPTPTH